jgi:hypothetical protein
MARKSLRNPSATTLEVGRPGAWSKEIRFSPKEFFASVGKAAVKASTGQWLEAIGELPEIIKSVEVTAPPEAKAWLLIRRSLARAALELIKEFCEDGDLEGPPNSDARDEPHRDVVFKLDPSFFIRPAAQIIPPIRNDFEAWLISHRIPSVAASNMARRIDSYFATAIHNEWRSDPEYYGSIRDALVSPFVAAAEDVLAWRRYADRVANLLDQPVFGESFSLRQIYVEPRGYLSTASFRRRHDRVIDRFEVSDLSGVEKPRVVQVVRHIEAWLSAKDKDDAVIVLTGGPGAGKSSLSVFLVDRLLRSGNRVILVPIQYLNTDVDFVSSFRDFVLSEGFFRDNPIAPNNLDQTIILVLDGLDELEMQGKAINDAVLGFVRDVVRTVYRLNSSTCRVQIILSGRELAVQAIEGEFRKPGQLVVLFPYYVPEQERSLFIDPSSLLRRDQRDIWWARYGGLTGRSFKNIPGELKAGEVGEVTGQPLLNYLVALAYQRQNVELSNGTNINALYGDLIKAVYERSWSRRPHPALGNVPEADFVRFLEEVALAVWHGHGRTTTIKEIEQHCRAAGVYHIVSGLEQEPSAGISRLLLAFYFRQKGRSSEGDHTFEFTHKTFGEYLSSLRIVRAVGVHAKQIALSKMDSDAGWTDQDALDRWLSLFGPSAIDQDLFVFVVRELRAREFSDVAQWQDAITHLYNSMWKRGWPMERFPRLDFREQLRWARNAEEAIFACLSASARVTQKRSRVEWPNEIAFGEALKRLQGQRRGPLNELIMGCLDFLELSDCCLDMADLYGANLHGSNLSQAQLNFANLCHANLSKTILKDAILMEANLRGVDVIAADFSGAALAEARVDRPRQMTQRHRIQTFDWTSKPEEIRASLRQCGAIISDDVDRPEVLGEVPNVVNDDVGAGDDDSQVGDLTPRLS